VLQSIADVQHEVGAQLGDYAAVQLRDVLLLTHHEQEALGLATAPQQLKMGKGLIGKGSKWCFCVCSLL
jgi:hypothetical protein